MDILLSVIFVVLNFLDFITTRKILSLNGYEMNPIVRFLMKFNIFLPVKIIVTLILAIVIIISPNYTPGIILCIIMSVVVINNYYQLYLSVVE